MGVYDRLILYDCGTASICILQKFFFFRLEFEGGWGNTLCKVSGWVSLAVCSGGWWVCHTPRSGRDPHGSRCQPGGWWHISAGFCGSREGSPATPAPTLAVSGKDISGMSCMQIRCNNNPEHNMLEPTPNVFRLIVVNGQGWRWLLYM